MFFLQVCDYDLIGGGDPIGKIMLGWTQNKSYKPGFKHWKEALENPRRPIIKWHVLQVCVFYNQTTPKKVVFLSTGFFSNLSMFRRFVPRSGVMVKPICKALEISCIFKYVQHYSPHIMKRTLTAYKNGLKCPIISFKKATGAHRNRIGKRIKWTMR